MQFLLRMSVLFDLQIIEEGPITVAPPETVKQLEQGAWRLAKCVNYIGAATVEYIYHRLWQVLFFRTESSFTGI